MFAGELSAGCIEKSDCVRRKLGLALNGRESQPIFSAQLSTVDS